MTLKEQIQNDRIVAMKAGDKRKRLVLSTLMGELDRIDKNPNDAQVIKKIKNMVDGNIECHNEMENEYLEVYLPKIMSENELAAAIQNATIKLGVDSMKGMGLIMKELQQSFPGQYDGKLASELVKKCLA